MRQLQPYPDFKAAVQEVLDLLHQRLGFDLWMVTRVDAEDWIVLQALDQSYGVTEHTIFRWSDSFCSRMVRGQGPRIAPRVADVPAYVEAPVGRVVQIGAYVGVPIHRADGSLFGTLCAIQPGEAAATIVQEQPLVEVFSRMIATLLDQELNLAEALRQAEHAAALAMLDSLTGLYNRRGWQTLADTEASRAVRHGQPLGLVMIDLDNFKLINDRRGHAAGDEHLVRTADTLRQVVREHDVVARLGGDEFGIMLVECGDDDARQLVQRIGDALDAADIRASIGYAPYTVRGGLIGSLDVADQNMYAAKAVSRRALASA